MFLPPFLKLDYHKLNIIHNFLKVFNFQNMIWYPVIVKEMESRIKPRDFKTFLCL